MNPHAVLPRIVPAWCTPARVFVAMVGLWSAGWAAITATETVGQRLGWGLVGAVAGLVAGKLSVRHLERVARWMLVAFVGPLFWLAQILQTRMYPPPALHQLVLFWGLCVLALYPLARRTARAQRSNSIDAVFSLLVPVCATLLVLLVGASFGLVRTREHHLLGVSVLFVPSLLSLGAAVALRRRIRWLEGLLAGADPAWVLAELDDPAKRALLPVLGAPFSEGEGASNTVLIRRGNEQGTAFRGGAFVPLCAQLPLGGLETMRGYRTLQSSALKTALACGALSVWWGLLTLPL